MHSSDLFSHRYISVGLANNYRRISDLIANRDFEVPSPITLPTEFKLGNHSRSIESLINSEICKYACASLETFIETKPDRLSSKSISWSLIRTYYASFFAAHACLKAVGQFVTRLDAKTCDTILKEAQYYYPTCVKPCSTDFYLEYNISNRLLIFKQIDNSNGSYHEKFWRVFNAFLDIGISSPLSSQTTYQTELIFIKNLKDNLNITGKPSWLTITRNYINYQLPEMLWFPFDKTTSKSFYDNIIRTCQTKSVIPSGLNSTDDYLKFNSTCIGIINLMIDITEDYFNKCSIQGNQKKAIFFRLLGQFNKKKYVA